MKDAEELLNCCEATVQHRIHNINERQQCERKILFCGSEEGRPSWRRWSPEGVRSLQDEQDEVSKDPVRQTSAWTNKKKEEEEDLESTRTVPRSGRRPRA